MERTKMGQPVPQLPVQDVEQAQIYYRNVLGFDIAWTYPDKSIGAVGREGMAVFFAWANGVITPNIHWIFAENIDLTYTELKNRGADIIEEIENKPWDMRQFAIRDLNGHVFYIHHDL